jgi:hypothetical protein
MRPSSVDPVFNLRQLHGPFRYAWWSFWVDLGIAGHRKGWPGVLRLSCAVARVGL